MKNVSIVIGANYGDCGKGLMTDYLSNPNTLIVRHNGGAQAGHTVNTPTGLRHVFHHFGSGSFRGSSTLLGPQFITNPILYMKELKQLHHMNVFPNVYIDPNSPITTPYEMMVNQAAEKYRGEKKHGSCGTGIGETIEREGWNTFHVGHLDHMTRSEVREILDEIRTVWAPTRAKELGITEEIPYLMADGILERFIQDCYAVKSHAKIIDWSEIYNRNWYESIVFEGAQGLQLDQDNPQFPYVTRSKTGIVNAIKMLEEVEHKSPVEIYYMSRVYNTRHGAGPLKHEVDLPYKEVVDETNKTNEFQGSLRFAYLELEDLVDGIKLDLKNSGKIKVNPNICFTCVDQLNDDHCVRYLSKDFNGVAGYPTFASVVAHDIGARRFFSSYGPTRNSITETKI